MPHRPPITVLKAGLRGPLNASIGAPHPALLALIGEAVLHFDADRAADGIQAEDRIVGHQRHPVDRHFRDKIPVDDVPIGLVDAHAILIDGNPLRGSGHRRGDEAAVVEVALERVAGLIAQRHEG